MHELAFFILKTYTATAIAMLLTVLIFFRGSADSD